ncbi:MAG: hypothetical protein M3445_08015, partial [Actinomycetota bacterium]|nr:hypothetical protein [Actinomycetota bacterium]
TSYFEFFSGMLQRDGVTLTGDVTPAYALLSADRLAWIRAGFEERGVRPLAVFVIRDPVERVWSAVRMQQLRRPREAPATATADELVVEFSGTPDQEARTRYDVTCRHLDLSFPAAQRRYVFFEELFGAKSLSSLCDFVGIVEQHALLDRRINASPKADQDSLSEEAQRSVAHHFRDVYTDMAARFGTDVIRHHWASSRFVL